MKMQWNPSATGLAGLLVAASVLLTVRPAQAQSMDPRWLPWVGCWQPLDSIGLADDEAPMMCFRPVAGQRGVEMLSVEGAEITSHRMVEADGQAHQEEREGCSGTMTAQFSSDGQRAFTVADMQCEGGVERRTTSIMSLDTPTRWLDVKSLDVGGQSTPWVERYGLASPSRVRGAGLGDLADSRGMAVRAARMAAISPIDGDDVAEASKIVDAAAVKAWVAERGDRFALNADELVRLSDAGVPGDVIDVMVAVSYPQKFSLAGRPNVRTEEAPQRVARAYEPSRFRGCDPFFWDPFCFGYGYGYGYSPFSYGYGNGYGYGGYFGGYNGGWGYGGGYTPVFIDVQPNTSAPTHGRVIKGRGYVPGGAAESGGGSVRSGTSSSGSGASAAPTRSSGSSSSGGRTAHRRGGGSSSPSRPMASTATPRRSSSSGSVTTSSHTSTSSSSGQVSAVRTAHRRVGSGR